MNACPPQSSVYDNLVVAAIVVAVVALTLAAPLTVAVETMASAKRLAAMATNMEVLATMMAVLLLMILIEVMPLTTFALVGMLRVANSVLGTMLAPAAKVKLQRAAEVQEATTVDAETADAKRRVAGGAKVGRLD